MEKNDLPQTQMSEPPSDPDRSIGCREDLVDVQISNEPRFL
jgi:hypothetical protein